MRTTFAPASNVFAIAATEGCACAPSVVSSHQHAVSALQNEGSLDLASYRPFAGQRSNSFCFPFTFSVSPEVLAFAELVRLSSTSESSPDSPLLSGDPSSSSLTSLSAVKPSTGGFWLLGAKTVGWGAWGSELSASTASKRRMHI